MGYKRHKKSSKRKQKLHEEILRKKSPKNEKEYKNYKQLFEKIKKDSKKEKLSFYKNDIKNTRKILKDVIGKTKINENRPPKEKALENKKITDQKTIAQKFNEFDVNVGPNLASKYRKTTLITNHTCLTLQQYLMSKTSQNKSSKKQLLL